MYLRRTQRLQTTHGLAHAAGGAAPSGAAYLLSLAVRPSRPRLSRASTDPPAVGPLGKVAARIWGGQRVGRARRVLAEDPHCQLFLEGEQGLLRTTDCVVRST